MIQADFIKFEQESAPDDIMKLTQNSTDPQPKRKLSIKILNNEGN